MFHLKKILSPFLLPIPLCLEILFLGLWLLWFTRRQRTGKTIVTAGALLVFLFSFSPVSEHFLAGLEYRYSPLPSRAAEGVHWIVVLGDGFFCDTGLPPGNQVPPTGMFRLIEGVRLFRENPSSKLIFTGHEVAPIMAGIAKVLGVPENGIVVEPGPRDTEEEAKAVSARIGGDRFILVTSAAHMPRAMALFEKEGMRPISAPAEYLVRKSQCPLPHAAMPSAEGFRISTTAVYEYLGLAWLTLRGRI